MGEVRCWACCGACRYANAEYTNTLWEVTCESILLLDMFLFLKVYAF